MLKSKNKKEKEGAIQKKSKSSLLSCVSAPEKEVERPISETDRIRLVVEIVKNIHLLEHIQKKTPEEENLLKLMQKIIIFSEKKEGIEFSYDERIVNNMLDIYAKKSITWSEYENATESTVGKTIEERMNLLPTISAASSENQQLQKGLIQQVSTVVLKKEEEIKLNKPAEEIGVSTLNDEMEEKLSMSNKGLKGVAAEFIIQPFLEEDVNLTEFQQKAAEMKASREGKNKTSTQTNVIYKPSLGIQSPSDSKMVEIYFDKAKQLLEASELHLEKERFEELEFELQEKNCSIDGFNEQALKEFTESLQTMISKSQHEVGRLSTISEGEESRISTTELDKLLEGLNEFIASPTLTDIENSPLNPECKAENSLLQQLIRNSSVFKSINTSKCNDQQNNAPVVLGVTYR